MLYGCAQINQNAERLAGRVFSVKHHAPRLANHLQPRDGFVSGKLRLATVERGHAARFELAQAVEDHVQILLHQSKEDAADEKSETGESRQTDGIKKIVSA